MSGSDPTGSDTSNSEEARKLQDVSESATPGTAGSGPLTAGAAPDAPTDRMVRLVSWLREEAARAETDKRAKEAGILRDRADALEEDVSRLMAWQAI